MNVDFLAEHIRGLAAAAVPLKEPFFAGTTPVPVSGPTYGPEEIANAIQAACEFQPAAGPWAEKLESKLASYFGAKRAYLTNSGSSANFLAVAALVSEGWLEPGDEVITVAAAFPTTVAPIVQHGLVPVFVDVDWRSANVDTEWLERARTPRTRAVMLAHTLGNPFDLDAVTSFCKKHNLCFIEDACDAAGAVYRGAKVGSFGHLATLSFYPAHQMTTGEGGAVLVNDTRLARAVVSLRDWGRDCWCAPGKDNTCGKRFSQKHGGLPEGYDHKYVYSRLGYNLRMTDMQAAIGCAQIEKLGQFVQTRRENWGFYYNALCKLEDRRRIGLPAITPHASPSPFGFLIGVRSSHTRNAVVHALEAKKIGTRPLFAGNLLRQPAMVGVKHAALGGLPGTNVIAEHSFWIGVHPGVTPAMRDYVVETLEEIFR